jgi:hypothetical protein
MTIYLPNPHNQVVEFLAKPLDAWLTPTMPFPTNLPFKFGVEGVAFFANLQ